MGLEWGAMGRPPLALGTAGEIRCYRTESGYRARALTRDYDGRVRAVERRGRTKTAAESALKLALRDRAQIVGRGHITAASRVSALADAWYDGLAELSPVTMDAYRRRLDTLAAEADAADRAGDRTAATRLAAERQALVGELSRAAGLAGRHRLASLENERARVNVTRTLRAAIERIAPAAPGAAAHLRASVRTGLACRYDPAPGGPSRWHV